MGNIPVAPTLTSQVRDLVYLQGLQSGPVATSKVTVSRNAPTRAEGTIYHNGGSSAMYVSIDASATAQLVIGTSTAAQGLRLAGIVNPGELYYLTSVGAVTVVNWVEYVF